MKDLLNKITNIINNTPELNNTSDDIEQIKIQANDLNNALNEILQQIIDFNKR